MAEQVDLQRLVTDYLTAAGAAVDPRSYALIEVLLPDCLAEFLGVTPHTLLAFDLEVARENAGAEFITYGHPLLDRVLQGCLGMGRTVRLYAATVRLTPPSNLQARIAGALDFVGARGARVVHTQIEEQHTAWFQYRLTLQADEKRLQVAGVLLDLHTALPLDHLAAALGRTFWDTAPDAVLPAPVTVPMALAYREASKHLEQHALRQALAEFDRELRPYRERELSRVQGYYDSLATDMRRRIELAGPSPSEKRAKLEQKLVATEEDRQRRVKDLRDKYSPRAAAALEAVTWYVWPRVRVRLLVDRRTRQDQVDVWYDLMANITQPLPCVRCRTWQTRVDLTPAGEPCCPDGCSGPLTAIAVT